MDFSQKPILGCVHLLPTVGAPQFDGGVERIYEVALREAQVLLSHGVDALVVENFRDGPFFPERVPAETVATLAGVTREIVRIASVPVGVAVLRNDAESAVAIAAATNARFVRINVHVGAARAAQGTLEGRSYRTLRLRNALRADVAIFADAAVKHAQPFAYDSLADEVHDLSSCSDAIIVSGALTGLETDAGDLAVAKRSTRRPVLVGSGTTLENLPKMFAQADGIIVGSFFKRDGVPTGEVDGERVRAFMNKVRELRAAR